MNAEQVDELVGEIFGMLKERIAAKRREYEPTGEDRLGNLKRCAARRNTLPEDVVLGLMVKHDDAVEQAVHAMKKGGITPSMDFWEEKLGDRIVYNLLLWALVAERIHDGRCTERVGGNTPAKYDREDHPAECTCGCLSAEYRKITKT